VRPLKALDSHISHLPPLTFSADLRSLHSGPRLW
jgi:hypothetical protein